MTKLFTIVNQTIACLMSKKLATFNLKTIKTKNNGGTTMRKREKKDPCSTRQKCALAK